MTTVARWAREKLGYRFVDDKLLDRALTHRSASTEHNERLEFLGDAVLGLVIAEEIFHRRPDASEGTLSRSRSRLVRTETLAALAREAGLGELIRLGDGERRSGGSQRQSVLANTLEAVLGALYLDGGPEVARGAIRRLYGVRLDELPDADSLRDPKTRLQEWLQARGHQLPVYLVSKISGAPHARFFDVSCSVESLQLLARGSGRSRRGAEQEAARNALAALEARPGATEKS